MNFIVAVSKNYAIGKNNDLLFNLPTDLKYFKEKTINKTVIMGDRTYYSLPVRPLPKRTTIVLTNNPEFNEQGVIIVRSLEELFKEVKKYPKDDVLVCGGATVYNLLMDYCEKAYITKIDKIVDGDVYINNIDEKENWKKIESGESLFENNLKFKFEIYENSDVKEF